MTANYPKRSKEGSARHAKKRKVRRHGDHSAALSEPKKKRGRR